MATADSKEQRTMPNDWLLGGILSAMREKETSLIDSQTIKKGWLYNQMAFKLNYNYKIIAIINLYRIPATSSNGVYYLLNQ